MTANPSPGRAAALALAVLLTGCATPTERADRLATAAGLEKRVVAGEPFQHLVYIKRGGRPDDGFRVYLEGDGTPWYTRYEVATDPTPRRPLMLRLMRLDPGPALYLGRPCYFGLMSGCAPEQWTSHRYSERVVESMVAALEDVRGQLRWRGAVTLLGHSGGGVLAMLMAPRIQDTEAVLTVAANLDIDAWTRHHGYSRLTGSLNPAESPPLRPRIRQLHLVGGRDKKVPPEVTRAGLGRQAQAEVVRYPKHGHHCCWEDAWPGILDEL